MILFRAYSSLLPLIVGHSHRNSLSSMPFLLQLCGLLSSLFQFFLECQSVCTSKLHQLVAHCMYRKLSDDLYRSVNCFEHKRGMWTSAVGHCYVPCNITYKQMDILYTPLLVSHVFRACPETSEMMVVIFWTTSLGKKPVLPIFQLHVLVNAL